MYISGLPKDPESQRPLATIKSRVNCADLIRTLRKDLYIYVYMYVYVYISGIPRD